MRRLVGTRRKYQRTFESLEQRWLLTAPVAEDDFFSMGKGASLSTDVVGQPQDLMLLPSGSEWRYLDTLDTGAAYPVDGASHAWNEAAYDDSAWTTGAAVFGYGGIDAATITTPLDFGGDAAAKRITNLFRRTFDIGNVASINSLTLSMLADDGAAVYFNGVEVVRYELPGALGDGSLDTGTNAFNAPDEEMYHQHVVDPSVFGNLLVHGQNTIAVEVHQRSPDSSDTAFDLEITASTIPTGGVLLNDSDADGDPLTAALLASTSHGVLDLRVDGTFTYTPAPDFSGIDTFSYLADDGGLTSDPATVTIEVIASPVANDDAYAVDEDSTLTIDATAGVLQNDLPAENEPLSAILVDPPAQGSLILLPAGGFEYIPAPDFFGVESFTYVADNDVYPSQPATVTITVNPINDAPVSQDDEYSIDEDAVLNTDDGGDSTEVTLVASGATWRYLDDGADQGDQWQSRGFDDSQWKEGAAELGYGDGDEVTLVDFGPNAANKFATTYFRHSFDWLGGWRTTDLTLRLLRDDGAAVYLNGVEVIRDNLADAATFDQLATGTVGGAEERTFYEFSVDPALLVSGPNVLAVEVHQGDAASSDLSFNLSLTASVLASPGVLGNDADADGDLLTVTLVDGVSHGLLDLAVDGSFTYTPEPLFAGTDSFTYRVSDGQEDSDVTSATIVVNFVNDSPLAAGEDYELDEDETLSIEAAGGLLVNDSDEEGEPLMAVLASGPQHGGFALQADGSFSYTPVANFNGLDSFTYVAHDGFSDSAPVTVTLTILPINDAPEGANDAYVVAADSMLVVEAADGVLANDTDVDPDPLTAVLVDESQSGVVAWNPDGSFSYTPHAGFHGVDQFTYRASDGAELSNLATVTIAVDSPPLAADEEYVLEEDQTLHVPAATGVLANDSDEENDALTGVLLVPPVHGALTFQEDGSFDYVPEADFFGADNFTYRANDGDQFSNAARVILTVTAVNDLPVVNDDKYLVKKDGSRSVSAAAGVLANDVDVDGPTLAATLLTDVASGTLTFAADGSFDYVPDAGFEGSDSFTYLASDSLGDSREATVELIVLQSATSVVINEIMYHPASENSAEEFIELFNVGSSPVRLLQWRFDQGLDFVFPDLTIGPGEYLVVAADETAFAARYPDVTNMVGGWTGRLSNRGESIELEDGFGDRIDLVEYFDEGDWALRVAGPNDRGHRGWVWEDSHDGGGRSLELRNADLSNKHGQNWGASLTDGGTPGEANSLASSEIAPFILDVTHFPAVPRSDQSVTITARLLADSADVQVTAFYRVSSLAPESFIPRVMFDDGQHGDGQADDGVFGAILPAQVDQTVVEFYVSATDGVRERTWPAPTDDQGTQGANALYQVDDSTIDGGQPAYRLILTAAEDDELRNIDRQSNAQMNATFINTDGVGTEIRYNAGVRIRGQGSRGRRVPNYRISFPSDRAWQGVDAINVNSQYTYAQLTGMTLFEAAGLASEDATAAQLRVNGVNLADEPAQQGSYVRLETPSREWAENHFPNDPDGNFYRGQGNGLVYRGESADSYRGRMDKETNVADDDWSDFIALTRALNEAETPDSVFRETVEQVANVDQWMRFMAVNALLVNEENGLINGAGDDWSTYRGVVDPRFVLVPHDMDSVFNEGDSRGRVTRNIFEVRNNQQLNRLLDVPEYLDRYYFHLQDLAQTIFSPAQLNPFLDNLLGGFVSAEIIERMQDFAAQRVEYVLSQIPDFAIPPLSTIAGEPPAVTPLDAATLMVGGQDLTQYRYSLNGSEFGEATSIDTPLVLAGLADGQYTVEVIGRNSQGDWQDVSQPTRSRSWTVNSHYSPVRIHEVLAFNQSVAPHEGVFPDLIELYNAGAADADLSGVTISDNAQEPGKFQFPEGLVLGAGQYLVLYADSDNGATGIHLGFSLDAEGDEVYLFDSAAAGGQLLDHVEFGLQLPDRSIGRTEQFQWTLNQPTFGAENTVQSLGDPANVRINEWLADGDRLFDPDLIELYNPDPLPVALGGAYLTDNPNGVPDRHQIAQLSFIDGVGYTVFVADGDDQAGADHLNFQLSSDRESIGLMSEELTRIDVVIFGPQSSDVSQGRETDGDPHYAYFSPPTFGLSNSESVNLPDVLALLDNLRITELHYDPYGGTDFEFVELQNTGDSPLNLEGVRFTNGVSFTFPSMNLDPGQYTVVVGNRTAFETLYGAGINIAGQYDGKFSNGGENVELTLPEPFFDTILDFTYNTTDPWPARADGKGSSLEVIDSHGDHNDSANWRASVEFHGAPGAANAGATASVVINEVLSNSEPPAVDYIELYNAAAEPVDISGWFLSDSSDNYVKFQLPAMPPLQPGQYLLLDETDFNPTPGVDPSFALDSLGDQVYLTAGSLANSTTPTRFVDQVSFTASRTGESFGRVPSGDASGVFYPQTLLTPGEENSALRVGPLVISELMYDPPDPGASHPQVAAASLEYVEIYNPTGDVVALADWTLDGIDFVFPADSSIGPGQAVVVLPFDPQDMVNNQVLVDAFEGVYGLTNLAGDARFMGGYPGKLNNAGEVVALYRAEEEPVGMPGIIPLVIEDQAAYDDEPPWPSSASYLGDSLTRLGIDLWGHDAASWVGVVPTPGSVSFTISNEPPVLDPIGAQSLDELSTWNFTATAHDSNFPADALTFSLDAASRSLGMTIDAATGALSWNPSEGQGPGVFSVTVTVTDNGAPPMRDEETFEITVGEVNTAPVLAAIGDQTVDELSTLSFTAAASDDDLPANALTFSLDAASLAVGMTIDGSTGEFSWTPSETQGPGTFRVTVTVTDNGAPQLSDSASFDLTVVNITPPQVTGFLINGGLADPPNLPKGAQPTNWVEQRSVLGALVVAFSEEVQVTVSDLVLTNLGLDAPSDPDQTITLVDDQLSMNGNALTINLAPSSELSDGVYRLEILSTVTSLSGVPLDGDSDGASGGAFVLQGDASNRFFQVTADWNGDEGVSIFDFPAFSYWFGTQTPEAPSYMDLNHDDGVSIFDFPVFAAKFGSGITFQPTLRPAGSPSLGLVPALAIRGIENRKATPPNRRAPVLDQFFAEHHYQQPAPDDRQDLELDPLLMARERPRREFALAGRADDEQIDGLIGAEDDWCDRAQHWRHAGHSLWPGIAS